MEARQRSDITFFLSCIFCAPACIICAPARVIRPDLRGCSGLVSGALTKTPDCSTSLIFIPILCSSSLTILEARPEARHKHIKVKVTKNFFKKCLTYCVCYFSGFVCITGCDNPRNPVMLASIDQLLAGAGLFYSWQMAPWAETRHVTE